MYARILKKDLKRKKTMNSILLIFIILAAMFISSSVQNVVTISSALDDFFKKAGLSDYIIIAMQDDETDTLIETFLQENEHVENYKTDSMSFINEENITHSDGSKYHCSSSTIISSEDIRQQKYFDEHNQEIKHIKRGEIYFPYSEMEANGLKKGESVIIKSGTYNKRFTIAGTVKDAFLGAPMMGTKRLVISDEEYQEFLTKKDDSQEGIFYSVNLSNQEAFAEEFHNQGFSCLIDCGWSLIRTSYVMDMVIAGSLIIISICLILISILILRFTIVFTLQEEFRQIGIMKAIGLQNGGIRKLYIIKYLALSIVGAGIGFGISIPFGDMLLQGVSKNIVMEAKSGSIVLNLVCSCMIVGIVILFSYFCTHSVNKLSPINAIRNGTTGERFKKKSLLKLSKCSSIPVPAYMAMNDIISNLKRYGVLMLTFMIGVILLIVPLNTINTLNSDGLTPLFGMAKSDLYLVDEAEAEQASASQDKNKIVNDLNQVKAELGEQGIRADVYREMVLRLTILHGANSKNSIALQGVGDVESQDYEYLRGTAPKHDNEVAITHVVADEIEADIGDTIQVMNRGKKEPYIVTAIYQSMNNFGEGIRFRKTAELDYKYVQMAFAVQIRYQGNVTEEQKGEYRDIIKELYPKMNIYRGGEYIGYLTGGVDSQIESVKQLILFIIIAINMLVTVLMVKSFIAKEKGEIAMMKSIGFRNASLVWWQVLRIGIVMVISVVLGVALSDPIAHISSQKVFEMMGASHIDFVVNPMEVYVMYPLILLAFTMLAGGITALQVRKITAQESNHIE